MKRAYCILRNKQQFDIGPDHPMYCCQEWVDNWINDETVPVSYRPDMRYYYLISDSRAASTQVLEYCFVCKHVFPENLMSQWTDIQEKEYGINEPFFSDNNPKEFNSEEWWRKRGL